MQRPKLKKPPPTTLPTSFPLKVGSKVYVSRRDHDGYSNRQAELWTVTALGRNFVQFLSDNGDHIRFLK